MTYIPLHVHSIYSPPRGIMTLREIVSRAVFFELPAIALTDHWSTYAHHEFFKLARAAGVKPVLGAEVRHASLTAPRGFAHLTLLAETNEGYRNLVSLVTAHWARERDHYVTVEELARHADGLIALTGCPEGEAAQAIRHGTIGRAKETIERLAEIFGAGDLYIELMNHGTQAEGLMVDHLRILSDKLGVPSVVTNNDRFALREEAEYYRIARRLGAEEEAEEDGDAHREFYLKREKDVRALFHADEAAVQRSGEIAERCSVDLTAGGRIYFGIPGNAHDLLVDLCRRRFLLKFHDRPRDERASLKRLMERELASAAAEDVSECLVCVRGIFEAARRREVWLELMGRDLLESFIAYLLGIVPLCPPDHDLVFESFAPAGRGTLPSLELIMPEHTKDAFINLVAERLPGYEVCFHLTEEEASSPTLAKEIGRVLGASPELREELARLLAGERRQRNLAMLLETAEPVRRLYHEDAIARSVLHAAFALQGRIVHFVQNSSRLVILPRETACCVAHAVGDEGERYAQLGVDTIEEWGGWIIGMQQSHFLSALEKALSSVERDEERRSTAGFFRENGTARWVSESLADPAVFAVISTGDTTGIYLLESQGMRDLLVKAKPQGFDELVNVISLYRPGPLEGRLWQRYIENAEKKGKVLLSHPALAPALEGTRGLLLYREQVREILEDTAGLAGERAVEIEEALISRDAGHLSAARLGYIRGAMDHELSEEEAQKIFDFLLHGVAFTHRKSLSCAQAYLSYRTAYLKAHHFERYFLALLNSNRDVKERLERYRQHLETRGVRFLPPGINGGAEEFTIENGRIRAPLFSIASIDREELEQIVFERSRAGDYSSLDDFLARAGSAVSPKTVLALVDSGVFDDAGVGRDQLKAICRVFLEGKGAADLWSAAQQHSPLRKGHKKKRDSERQRSLFD